MFTQNTPQRTYRHRNDQRQQSQQNVSNNYNRNHNSPQHYHHNHNRATYSYIINQTPSPHINSTHELQPTMPPSPHRPHPSHLHQNVYNSNYPQFRISEHQQQHQHPHQHQRAQSQPHHIHSNNNAYNHKYASQRKARNSNNNNNTRYYHQRNRSGSNALYQNYTEQHRVRSPSKPTISSVILLCIDNVGPQLIQYLPASTAYYLIEIIEPYLTNHNNDRIPLRRKSELLSKWHNSYASQQRMKQYLDSNDILNRLYHFNDLNAKNKALSSSLCVWDITIKQCEVEEYFGTSRNLLIRSILSYIIMECFLRNKHNQWFPVNDNICIKKQLDVAEIKRFLVSKLQKIDDIKKFYNINPKIEDNEHLLCLLNAFKARFERDNFGGDTLLYVQSSLSDKFENILSNLSKMYPAEKNRKRMKKSAIYEFGFRSRLDRPIFGFYIGKHKGFNPRTKGIELKFNPSRNHSYFYDLKWLFLPEFIEDQVLNYFTFDVKWESDYTRGEQFKYFNLLCADINCSNWSSDDLYQRFKFVVWKGQYFDADDNLLGQYRDNKTNK